MTYGKRPLEGVRVLDFTRVYSGPYCTMMLADLGAEVIKVEKNGTGDDTRAFMPMKDGESGYYLYLNRNKKSIALDMKKKESVEIVYRLAEWADVAVENFSPGVAERLGIGYDDLKKKNPAIIYGSISGFGQNGPYRCKPAYDVVCQAMGGFMSLTGEAGGKPYKLGPSIVDASAGIHMAFAIVSALFYREKTGVGQFIDIGMMDTAFSTLENFVVTKTLTGVTPTRNGNANLGSAPFNSYRTRDGYVTIAVANNSLFDKLTTVMDRRDLLQDERLDQNYKRKMNEDILDVIIEEWTQNYTTKEICDMLDAAGVPVGPILGIDELISDPHLKEREMLVEIDSPVVGKVIYPGNPIKYSETKVDRFESAPGLGENTKEILAVCGYENREIEELMSKGII
ncbi:CaiB/BaiF CoA transferase family protein [Bacilliculturomica massiliensis]|uniref:CaiB/BaiF CoA transferase family protein n=1 Tax=Bacilliculturomica massiliensis TaxID=1917867 RepID=UPI001030FFCD|nr:CoA transferase [Bacilliculturomica massiliensis]